MTEQQAIEALHALPRLPRSGASLERMRALLDHLGNPEKQFKCIHIAGTNGKGTLAAMTSSILTHAGYKTGLTISPYVLNFRERFQINGQMMSPRTLASLTRKVLDAADAIIAEGGEGPVEFEAVTAIAFLWFARQKCDFAVVETGLGGRYDATNVIPAPLVAAITRIGMDHTEILGDTLAEIAAEKAGIIKEGSVVVCYPEQPEEAMGPLLTAAANAHTSLVVPDTADLQQLKCRPLETMLITAAIVLCCNSPASIRPTMPLWRWKLPWPSGGNTITRSPMKRLKPVCGMPKCPHGSRSCAATRCCCWMAATMPMVPQPLLQL